MKGAVEAITVLKEASKITKKKRILEDQEAEKDPETILLKMIEFVYVLCCFRFKI